MDPQLLKFAPLVRAMARRYQGPGLEGEDLEQEAWLALLEAEESYCPERNVPRPAFYQSRVRGALGEVLRRYRRDALFWRGATPVEALAQGEHRSFELLQSLSVLSQRQRQVISMYYWHQLSLRQIAAELGISISAVQVHKGRGLKALARLLSL
jgi:RNA polymerase sigma factor (sigma-70 family)